MLTSSSAGGSNAPLNIIYSNVKLLVEEYIRWCVVVVLNILTLAVDSELTTKNKMWQPDPFHNELVFVMDELMTSLEDEIDKCMAVLVFSTQDRTDIDAGETGEFERESRLEVKVSG